MRMKNTGRKVEVWRKSKREGVRTLWEGEDGTLCVRVPFKGGTAYYRANPSKNGVGWRYVGYPNQPHWVPNSNVRANAANNLESRLAEMLKGLRKEYLDLHKYDFQAAVMKATRNIS